MPKNRPGDYKTFGKPSSGLKRKPSRPSSPNKFQSRRGGKKK